MYSNWLVSDDHRGSKPINIEICDCEFLLHWMLEQLTSHYCWKSFLVDCIIATMKWTDLPTNTMLLIRKISKNEQGATMLQLKDTKTRNVYNILAPAKLCKDITIEDVIYRDENCICDLCILPKC